MRGTVAPQFQIQGQDRTDLEIHKGSNVVISAKDTLTDRCGAAILIGQMAVQTNSTLIIID